MLLSDPKYPTETEYILAAQNSLQPRPIAKSIFHLIETQSADDKKGQLQLQDLIISARHAPLCRTKYYQMVAL